MNLLFNILRNKSFVFTVFSVCNSGINFILLLILARFLTPTGYGALNLFTTLLVLINIIITLNCSGLFSVEYFKQNRKYLQEMVTAIFLLSLIVGCILIFIIYVAGCKIDHFLHIKNQMIYFCIYICIIQTFSFINLEIWRVEEAVVKYGIYTSLNVCANFILTILFVSTMKMDWEGRVYANVLVSSLFGFISIYIISKKGYLGTKISYYTLKQLLSFGIPLIPHDTSSWIRQGVDRYVIANFYTNAEVGWYSFAFNFANIIHIIGSAFNKINAVSIFKELTFNDLKVKPNLLRQNFKIIILFLIISSIIFGLSLIFIFFYFNKYEASYKFIFPLCLSAFFQATYYLFVNYFFYYKKTVWLMYITTTLSVLHIVLSIIFTKISILYTAYVTLGINLMITIIVFYGAVKIYKRI